MPTQSSTPPIRLAELMAALSIATDFGMGQPLEFALQACVVAVRLGEHLTCQRGKGADGIIRDKCLVKLGTFDK